MGRALQIELTDQQTRLLQILVDSGIWGETMEETAKQIVLDGLKETVGRAELRNASNACSIGEGADAPSRQLE